MREDRTRRIQERAYALWEREGRPPGREAQHWSQAEREVAAEDEALAAGSIDPLAKPRPRKPKPVRINVEEAPKPRRGDAATAEIDVSAKAPPRTRGRKAKAVTEDGAAAPRTTRGRKAKAVSGDAVAKRRKPNAAVLEETTQSAAGLAQQPPGAMEGPDKAE